MVNVRCVAQKLSFSRVIQLVALATNGEKIRASSRSRSSVFNCHLLTIESLIIADIKKFDGLNRIVFEQMTLTLSPHCGWAPELC